MLIPIYLSALLVFLFDVSAAPSSSNLFLTYHNQDRAKHGVPDLQWNNTLESQSSQHASLCQFQHSNTPNVGENIYVSTSNDGLEQATLEAWYSEISAYNYADPGFSESTGHFTQVVWKSTETVGCASAQCDAKAMMNWDNFGNVYFVVCQYFPAGNIEGEFAQNVLPPK